MVRKLCTTLIWAALLTLVTAPAGAFWKSKEKDRELDRIYLKAPLFNKFPAMELFSGELVRDGITGWSLGGKNLVLTKDSRVDGARPGAALICEGCRALVLGYRSGNVVVVHLMDVQSPQEMSDRGLLFKRKVEDMPQQAPLRRPL